MEAVIVLILVIVIICWACYRRKVIKAVYGIAALEILLQVFNLIANNIGDNAVSSFMSRFPNRLLAVAYQYTSGIIYTIIVWLFIGIMVVFLWETLRIFFKK